jgi:alpha-mannosidase
VTAAKKAAGGEDLILRLFEPTGRERTTTVSLPCAGLSKEVILHPFEIRTYRVHLKTGTWTETDLLEKPI